jgi:hypothetical protein
MNSGITWRMITGEYPPQAGGVSDYSRVVARGLVAAGDTVHVYAPEFPQRDSPDDGITINRLPGHFGPRALMRLSRILRPRTDDRLLVQYVPHAFGFKAMNLPFCLWLLANSRKFGHAIVMFHEVQLGILAGDPARYRLIDTANKIMAMLAARSATRIFIATPTWEPLLRRYAAERPIVWMPVPSTIPVIEDRVRVADARRRWSAAGRLLGHFGTYSPPIARMLRAIIPAVLAADSSADMLLIGANGNAFRQLLISENPALANRIVATGTLPPDELSLAISSCEILLQPFPDGVTSRRTSMMAGLAHARAIVTTKGLFTEPLWEESGAVAMVAAGDTGAFVSAVSKLPGDTPRRCHYASTAKALYANCFDVRHTVEALRGPACV